MSVVLSRDGIAADRWLRPTETRAFVCAQPFVYEFEGELRKRACGYCKGCMARAKRDRAARAAAEAATSAEVLGFTLTYRTGEPGARDFVVQDAQRFMYRLRARLFSEACRRVGVRERELRGARGDSADLRAWRSALREKVRAETPALFMLRVGETGSRGTRRKHWHLAVFSDKPTGLAPSPRRASASRRRGALMRENRPDLWPHGFITLDVLPGGKAAPPKVTPAQQIAINRGALPPPAVDPQGAVRLARYLCKYVEKSRGVSARDRKHGVRPDVVFASSNRRPLGSVYIEDEARRWAQAGLPFAGLYRVPGLRMSRADTSPARDRYGRAAGPASVGNAAADATIADSLRHSREAVHAVNGCVGAMRRRAIAAYKAEWQRLRPGLPVPDNDFMRWNDADRCESEYRQSVASATRVAAKRREPVKVDALPPLLDPARCCRVELAVATGEVVADVHVVESGSARFAWRGADDTGEPVYIGRSAAALGQFSAADAVEIDRVLACVRGPGWLTPNEWHSRATAMLEARDAAVSRFAKPSRLLLSPDDPDGPVIEGDTGLRRQLRLRGASHHAGILSRWERAGSAGPRKRPAQPDASAALPVYRVVLPGLSADRARAGHAEVLARLAALPAGASRRAVMRDARKRGLVPRVK